MIAAAQRTGIVITAIGAATSWDMQPLAWLGGAAALVTIVGGAAKLISRIRAARPAVRIDFEHAATAGLRVLNPKDYRSAGRSRLPPILHYRLTVRLANNSDKRYVLDGLWIANATRTKRVPVQLSEREIPARGWLTVPVRGELPDRELGFVAVAQLAGYRREISSQLEHLRDDLKRRLAESRAAQP